MTQLPQSPQLDLHSKISTTDHQSSTHQTLIASTPKAAACPTLTIITTSERTYISQKKTSTMTITSTVN